MGGRDEADVGGEGNDRQGFNARIPGGQLGSDRSDRALADFEGSPLPQPFKHFPPNRLGILRISTLSPPGPGTSFPSPSLHHGL